MQRRAVLRSRFFALLCLLPVCILRVQVRRLSFQSFIIQWSGGGIFSLEDGMEDFFSCATARSQSLPLRQRSSGNTVTAAEID